MAGGHPTSDRSASESIDIVYNFDEGWKASCRSKPKVFKNAKTLHKSLHIMCFLMEEIIPFKMIKSSSLGNTA